MSGVDLAFEIVTLDHYRASKRRQLILLFERLPINTMTVRPFAIDGNGKQVSHEVINALYHPNKSDSRSCLPRR